MWTYQQSTGGIWQNNGPVVALGYAGAPGAVNDPGTQHIRNVGPLPRGLYRMLSAVTHPRLGPVAIRLEPDRHNEMFDREDFWIHGDNRRNNRSGSKGCPVMLRPVRLSLDASVDRWLVVVA